MKVLLLSVLLLLTNKVLLGQQNQDNVDGNANVAQRTSGYIYGKVIDSSNQQPLPYVTVAVMLSTTNTAINGNLTGEKGQFEVDNLKPATYKIDISFLGYEHKVFDGIVISSKKLGINLGNIKLTSVSKVIDAVTISAQRSPVENKVDRLVYNVDNDITSQGSVATDVLRKVPQVDVDIDGNVQVAGSANVKVLIDGKPSAIFGANLAEALQAIPSSQIQKIEVITMPGAKYDAEGGSIINIILKKNTAHGTNGSVNVSGGTRLENGSANVNIRRGTFGINASLSGNGHLRNTTPSSSDRVSTDSIGHTTSRLTQNTQSPFYRESFQGQIGFDWDINKHNSITGGGGFNSFAFNSNNAVTNQQLLLYAGDASQTLLNTTNTIRNTSNINSFQALDGHINYKKTFIKTARELDAAIYSTHGTNVADYNQIQYYTLHDSLFNGAKNHNAGTNVETDYQIDYTEPINKNTNFEAGTKAAITLLSSNTDFNNLSPINGSYNYDSAQSPKFKYYQNVYAGYVSLSTKVLNYFDLKVGLRYEHTDLKADYVSATETILPSYDEWLPSANLSHTFANNNSIRFGYSKRLQRPGYRDLNPFINAADPTNITQGNPNLKPEIGNKFELTYSFYIKKDASINITANYNHSGDDIQPYVHYYSSLTLNGIAYKNVAVNSIYNIGVEYMAGINVFGNIPLGNRLTVRVNSSVFEKYIIDNYNANKVYNSYNYRIGLNATYTFSKTLTAEFFSNFRSARTEVLGKYPSFSFYSLAVKKQVLKKRGTIGFTTTNPFNLYIDQPTVLTGTNFALNADRKIPFRSFGISLGYQFGKISYGKRNGKGGGDDDDKDSDLSAPPAPKTPEGKGGDSK